GTVNMASILAQLTIRRSIAFLICAAFVYLMIGNSLMPMGSPDMDRSPEIKFEKHNESKTNTDGRHIGENPLLSEITKLEQLEMERALAASQENKSLCCDIAENKN
uniref:Beta-1,4-N-acetylgalactosaminyltransferase n=1 Tax=Parascaris univalens TaxID=6257 RepID=A0A914ZW69_PARUN